MWDSWSNLVWAIIEIANDVFSAHSIGEGLKAILERKKSNQENNQEKQEETQDVH